ncbi:uncharacterized protein LOC116168690 [Photinus pyralis]|uniref:uncharacterized protein LOC116168690 n=1 Tax=Photinus pyralis TaxID=7054 RepID=UPI0012670FE4|nr:uncharacterized protein LOC116168690 [Photinus pyralis]
MWSKYSMLRTTLLINDNVDIKYAKVIALLIRQGNGYKPKKAKIFCRNDLNRLLSEAPDDYYLQMKVALIIGLAGACRCDELIKLTLHDIQDNGDILVVKIPDSKTKMQITFVITNETINGTSVHGIYRKYVSLRSAKTEHTRFFVNYIKGKCTIQVIGKNTIAKIPYKIAKYLELPDAEGYTGHSFRRTSASLLVDAGGDLLSLKRHGGWRSTNVAEGYLGESIVKKSKVSNQITCGMLSSKVSGEHQMNSTNIDKYRFQR